MLQEVVSVFFLDYSESVIYKSSPYFWWCIGCPYSLDFQILHEQRLRLRLIYFYSAH